MAATAVTPVGVRDGDPDALAGLCDRRGPAVLAYCEVVAGRGPTATAAAADAFGSFRAGVVAAPDLAQLNPEALLISATRHAAARYAGGDAPEGCARVPSLLAARADRSITLADHDWLEEHLAGCWTCRAPVARFEAADRAYRDPPSQRLEPEVSAAILAALTAAAPILGQAEELPAMPAPADNGSVPRAYEQPAAPAGVQPGYVEQPTASWQVAADGKEQAEPVASEAPAPRAERAPRRTIKLGGALTREPHAAALPGADEQRSGRGAHLPRPIRASATGAAGRRGRPALRRGLVLPVVLVVLAIVIALLVAGVFSGNDPASAPQSLAPGSGTPTDTAPAPVVVVPGAADASAEAVERAKARTRAARRRAAAARRQAAETAAASATAAPTPNTPPPPPPAAAAGDPPATPPEEPEPTADDRAKIDAGKGATGAEEVPPSEDTSTVPDLAPPAETADPPGQ